ncbi:hypothetical protein FB451DRAFT_1358729 [Mycena latifolia]|nr:hypothetical protein FB451DRAFT_1358729 [Mycena latifolia]
MNKPGLSSSDKDGNLGREAATGKAGQMLMCQQRVVRLHGSKKPVSVPNLSLDDFCKRYGLEPRIGEILKEEGFEQTGALLEISVASLKKTKLRPGDIAELKSALRTSLTGED